jgi:hypothetical protein
VRAGSVCDSAPHSLKTDDALAGLIDFDIGFGDAKVFLGILKVLELLGAIDHWVAYDFPPGLPPPPDQKRYKWKGQKQRWFAFRFAGCDADFDLTAVPPQEFAEWRWEKLANIPPLIIGWKRAFYEEVVEAFSAFAR